MLAFGLTTASFAADKKPKASGSETASTTQKPKKEKKHKKQPAADATSAPVTK
jgi:hypothetical protein